mgnify:CR=1 FL=1
MTATADMEVQAHVGLGHVGTIKVLDEASDVIFPGLKTPWRKDVFVNLGVAALLFVGWI